MDKKYKFTKPEDFVRIWQKSKNLAEVAQRVGVDCHCVSVRASQYRRKGIPLKRFKENLRVDVTALKKIAFRCQ